MNSYEVINSFDRLLAELERVIPDLNAQMGELTAQKNYDRAQAVLDKAKRVIDFQQKVKALRQEWQSLDLQVPTPKPQPRPQPEPGPQTPQAAFRIPILQALVNLGGSAHCRKVFSGLERSMDFTKADWLTMPSNDNEIRWKNAARWERLSMVKEGLLASESHYGIWEITSKGRKYLEENK